MFRCRRFTGKNLPDLALEKSDVRQFILKNRGEVRAEIG
jgi:hypothetical protein